MRRIRVAYIAAGATMVALVAAGCGGGNSGSDAAATNPSATQSVSGSAEIAFDQAFIDTMVAHHEQAIEMSEAAKTAGLSNPDLVTIADAVIATQQGEIDQMLAWREEWFGSSTVDLEVARDALGLSMAEMGMEHDMIEMLGMDDIDSAFATEMTDHHEGAIRMAELALEQSERPEVRDLAERIIKAQQGEIEIMAEHMGMQHG